MSLLAAILLSLVSVGVLIFFVNHAQQRLYISNVIADLGQTLHRRVDELFPESLGAGAAQAVDWSGRHERLVSVDQPGYLQNVVDDELLDVAERLDCGIELLISPGEFVVAGQPAARILSPFPLVSEETVDRVRNALIVGADRTEEQDIYYVVDQLVQVATRALSPGVNDPFTANTCVDWLANSLARMAERAEPASYRPGKSGTTRLIAPPVTYQGFLDHAVHQLMPYLVSDTNARAHAVGALERVVATRGEDSEAALILRGSIKELRGKSEDR